MQRSATKAVLRSRHAQHDSRLCSPACFAVRVWVLRRLKLLSFLSAAARATNALLQRMTQARIEFNSSSLLESLLAAHRCCSTSIESLSALAGSFGVPGLSTLLQVQHHVLLMIRTCFTLEGHAGKSHLLQQCPLLGNEY